MSKLVLKVGNNFMEKYEVPKIEIINFEAQDVITVSVDENGSTEP